VILILSVVGNTSIIAIVVRNRSMRSRTINYLIANMAATDLVASVVVVPRFLAVLKTLSLEWKVSGVVGDILCKLNHYIRDVSLAVSMLSMVAIAFDRFFAVVLPMRATPRILNIRILIPVIWFVSLGTFLVHLINFKVISLQGVFVCHSLWPTGFDQTKSKTVFYLVFLTVIYIVPLAIVAVLYTIIALRIRRQKIPGEPSSESEDRRRKLNNNIVKMAVAIVFFFFVCWAPYHSLALYNIFSVPYHGVLEDVLVLLSYISFVINPCLCLTFSSKYRKCVKNLFPFSILFATRIEIFGGTSQRRRAAKRVQQTEMLNLKVLKSHSDNNEVPKCDNESCETDHIKFSLLTINPQVNQV
jgi:hypothetical protein